ncbi:MAG TPA: adenylate/guanylate cyclase domain-containing protein [Rhodocyclaceae bacterium]
MVDDSAAAQAILFADIVGSTLLYESVGDAAAHRTVAACLETLSGICARRGGRVVKTIGDEILAAFGGPDQALGAACEMQLAFRESGHVRLRVGFHAGPVVNAGGDVFGDTVNLAARVVELSNPGQILLTAEAYGSLCAESKAGCRKLYATPVRGRSGPVTLFEAVCAPDEELTVILGGKPAVGGGARLALSCGGRSWELNEGSPPLRIGRAAFDGIATNLPTASRHHATVAVLNGKFVLTDTSSNGTYVEMANGDAYVLRREELVLGGSGRIGLGCPAAQCGENALAFEVTR